MDIVDLEAKSSTKDIQTERGKVKSDQRRQAKEQFALKLQKGYFTRQTGKFFNQ
jgi:hypothetical protein